SRIACRGDASVAGGRRDAAARVVADTGIDVTSGGTRALVGRPMDPGSSRLLELGGVPAQDFRARLLAREMVAEADLVLGGRAGASQLRRPTVSAGHAQSDHYVVPVVVGGGTPGSRPVCCSTCALGRAPPLRLRRGAPG